MAHLKLAAETRTVRGKKVSRLRRDGVIPVVVYGGQLEESLALQVNERELRRTLFQAGAAQVIDLQVEGSTLTVLARVVERDPIRHDLMHVDFLAVRMDQLIEAEVPLTMVGESEVVTNNVAILMTPVTSVRVRALPDRLPSHLEVDISSLSEIGQQLTMADIQLPEGVEIVAEPEQMVAGLATPRMTVEEEEEAEAEAEAEALDALGEGDEADLLDEGAEDEGAEG